MQAPARRENSGNKKAKSKNFRALRKKINTYLPPRKIFGRFSEEIRPFLGGSRKSHSVDGEAPGVDTGRTFRSALSSFEMYDGKREHGEGR